MKITITVDIDEQALQAIPERKFDLAGIGLALIGATTQALGAAMSGSSAGIHVLDEHHTIVRYRRDD